MSRRWPSLDTPPYTQVVRTPHFRPASSSTSAIWITSSRVGPITSATGPFLPLSCAPDASCAAMCTIAGSPNASVFPDPVAAMPTTSWPARARGQHSAWIGLGCWKVRHACRNFLSRSRWANAVTGRDSRCSTTVIRSFRSAAISAAGISATAACCV